jgi:hypothetical protein
MLSASGYNIMSDKLTGRVRIVMRYGGLNLIPKLGG